ncbi:integral membrane protein [Aspergillus piperis CBS 112811]|uniref:Integral membrane protein n=1 Tax=Aspergillus piperis CBS 112811 TaxID=1448313 RepID=A0A8G1VLT3_9EURO|nr:integral membrane protein [Aspergillus piperis CBS 112811]RAH57921.1 integral membrane protein [Aspergillus piperis CBS 112811]
MLLKRDTPSGRLLPDIYRDSHQVHIFTAFAAIACYNAIELIILCLSTFKRRGSVYFWSLLVASLSIVPQCVGYILLFSRPQISPYGSVTLIMIGWCGMITGHSLVLWSRLHLVLQDPTILRYLLRLIILDDILLQIPITVLLYGTVSTHWRLFNDGYNIMERIQLVGFCLQEGLLSGLYVWEAAKLLRLRPEDRHRRILAQLIGINILVLILDIAVVGIQYAGYYALQVMFKPVAYSIKLKLEYAILGRLVNVVKKVNTQESLSTQCFDMLPSSSDGFRPRHENHVDGGPGGFLYPQKVYTSSRGS